MKVAHITCVYPPYGGGIGEVAFRYAALLAPEHEVTVFTPRYAKGMTFAKSAGVRVQAVRPAFSFGNAAWLPRLVHTLANFDVVHLHYPFFGAHEQLSQLPARQKLVVSYHMTPMAEGWKGKVFSWDTARYGPRLAKRADLLLAATQDYLAAEALPHFGELPKWRVLPLGVSEQYHPGEKPERLERQLKLRYSEQVVLFVGTLDAAHLFKGVSVLLRAMTQLPQDLLWRLVVVGGGNWRGRYQAEARRLGLGKRVTFTGFVSENELPEYYRLANVFVLPSTSQAEAFGLVALQAMASGVPVVASRLPGVRELVLDHHVGVLVAPGDDLALASAIESLLRKPEQASALGQHGAAVAATTYQWSAIGARLRSLYHELV